MKRRTKIINYVVISITTSINVDQVYRLNIGVLTHTSHKVWDFNI